MSGPIADAPVTFATGDGAVCRPAAGGAEWRGRRCD